MRMIDYRLATKVNEIWKGKIPAGDVCPLLADLDRLLVYLDENGITPGHVIDPCPECGQDHRWALLDTLMEFALDLRPANQSRLLTMVDINLEPLRELYGGKEGFKEFQEASAKYFNGLNVGRVYKP